MKRLFILLLFVLAGCGVAPEGAQPPTELATTEALSVCEPAEFVKQIEPLAREWTDTVKLANSTPRMQLAAQISKLQDIQRRTEALEAPTCAAPAQQFLTREMDITNQGFVSFLAQKPQDTIDELFVLAQEQQDGYKNAIKHLKAGEGAEYPEMFTDGLGITGSVLQAPFAKAGLKFGEWHGGTILGSAEDGRSEVRLKGTPENVYYASVDGSMNGQSEDRRKEIQGYFQTMLSLAMPDWKEGNAWLKSAMKLENGATAIANHGRYVKYERRQMGDTAWTLTIEVPQP